MDWFRDYVGHNPADIARATAFAELTQRGGAALVLIAKLLRNYGLMLQDLVDYYEDYEDYQRAFADSAPNTPVNQARERKRRQRNSVEKIKCERELFRVV
jgi:hypothetical protein